MEETRHSQIAGGPVEYSANRDIRLDAWAIMARADAWLRPPANPILKWDTERWG